MFMEAQTNSNNSNNPQKRFIPSLFGAIINPSNLNKWWIRSIFCFTTLIQFYFLASIITGYSLDFMLWLIQSEYSIIAMIVSQSVVALFNNAFLLVSISYGLFLCYKIIRHRENWYKHIGYIHLAIPVYFILITLITNIIRVINVPHALGAVLYNLLISLISWSIPFALSFFAAYLFIQYRPKTIATSD